MPASPGTGVIEIANRQISLPDRLGCVTSEQTAAAGSSSIRAKSGTKKGDLGLTPSSELSSQDANIRTPPHYYLNGSALKLKNNSHNTRAELSPF